MTTAIAAAAPHATALTSVRLAKAHPPAGAGLKYALVIGNGAYPTGKLENAKADADLIAETLLGNGFEVSVAKDLSRSALFDAVRKYTASLPQGAISVIYYAGHGMQVAGINYLVPVDMVPTSPATVGLKAYPLTALNERMALSSASANIVILDACRNNPFEPIRAVRMRSIETLGLAPTIAPRGTLIAYSTAPGQQAADGEHRQHSLYTETLARVMGKNTMPVEELFKTVADLVRQASLEDQQPWFESSLVGTLYLGATVTPQVAASASMGNKKNNPVAMRSVDLNLNEAKNKTTNNIHGSIGHTGDQSWYRTMNELDWTELDNAISLRAKNASEDQIPALRASARKGNVVAMTTLASIERLGTKSAVDVVNGHRIRYNANMGQALIWYGKAASLGFPVAQTELGELLYRGKETAPNKQDGLKWLKAAAEAHYPRAKIDLAQLQLESSGSPEDAQALILQLMGGTGKVIEQARGRAAR